MRTRNNTSAFGPGRVIILAGILLLGCVTAHSQSIVIGGDIYGGGRNGAVGTANANNPNEENVKHISLKSTNTATNININDGQVRTVFGGGENGRVYGSTSVTVSGGTIGDDDWDNTIHGGVFGAGDGQSAYVFGHSSVTMEGGTVYQNIYGGGNQANLVGYTSVTLKGGDILSTVYGGARVADIYGYSLVDIDGADATNNLIITAVYGGNDIGGSIIIPGQADNTWDWIRNLQVPSVISSKAKTSENDGGYGIDKTWNAFVHATGSSTKTIYVGQLFGGGNGDYTYSEVENGYTMSTLTDRYWDNTENDWVTPAYPFTLSSKPVVGKVYLELDGGNFGYTYGGGNQATVTGSTVLCLNNSTETLATLDAAKLRSMGINLDVDKQAYTIAGTGANQTATLEYQFDRVFGGNKQADMSILPKWHLEKGKINALYSGGDAGNMTHSTGLFLPLTSSDLEVNNVYGGCRIANVAPSSNSIGAQTYTENGVQYTYSEGYSARILITAGTIQNVYGGNDISGNVFGGTALEILSSINGEVYGGGNGSYVYTDKASLQNDPTYGDFYYVPGQSSIDALNAFRPSTSKTYIHIAGTSQNPTTVQTLYGGGNSTTVSDAIKLQIGSYTTIGNIFLGSNGANMITAETLSTYSGDAISSLNFKDGQGTFNKYMLGTAVSCQPVLTFDDGYPDTHTAQNESELAHVGSFYCGGNVGSMTSANLFDFKFSKPIVLTNKLVGGCNTAFVEAGTYNDRHEGGFTGGSSSNDKINLDIDGIIFAPENNATVGNQGNIFGGCFTSGIIIGNVTIDLKENIIPAGYFVDENARNTYITNSANLFNTPLSVFGGGYGVNATVQGNTTVKIHDAEGNNNVSGGALKVFGGGYGGTVDGSTTVSIYGDYSFAGRLYGGGFEGPVTGNTTVNLDGGTLYHSFGGACNANITGYAQTYLGAGLSGSNGYATVLGNVYGGNDFGGQINGSGSFYSRIPNAVRSSVYNPNPGQAETPYVVNASAYVEYQQGKITNNIFGGSCGAYNYTQMNHDHTNPYLANAFVNFIPTGEDNNTVQKVFGAGEGNHGTSSSDNYQDQMQDRSYILVDIETDESRFTKTDVFGAGANSGLGMRLTAQQAHSNTDAVTAVIDLVKGQIQNAYGASFSEGVTRRTIVNVPQNSSIRLANIFGGGYGDTITSPCDAIETIVNYNSPNAIVTGAVYGGNNNCRRTLYSQINVSSKLRSNPNNVNYTGYIYGGGKGANTWSFYTEVNMLAGADAYMVYGGGDKGNVLNRESFQAWIPVYASANNGAAIYATLGSDYDTPAAQDLLDADLMHPNKLDTITNTNVYYFKDSHLGGYTYGGGKESHVSGSTYIGLHGGIIRQDMYAAGESGDVRDLYGAGFRAVANAYVEGGQVRRVYGGGWKGNVGHTELPFNVDENLTPAQIKALMNNDDFATANVVIGISKSEADLMGYTDYGFYHGIPAIEWNAYGAGERGGIIGTANLTLNNGYIGYRYFAEAQDSAQTTIDERYREKLDDETADDGIGRNYLIEHGNLFGGGYDDGSFADTTIVKVYDGYIRNSVYGGGEIAAVGRGETRESGNANSVRELKGIYRAGKASAFIYGGLIKNNVFGGGKGYSATKAESYAYSSTRRYTDGYVFGQTEANVYGGVIGTSQSLKEGEGNVFGGGNIGYVYTKVGKKDTDGYYYRVNEDDTWELDGDEKQFSEDSKVVVSPWCRVKDNKSVTIDSKTYYGAHIDNVTGKFVPAEYVPTSALNKIEDKSFFDTTKIDVKTGIIIRNAVFAGGNVSQGSDLLYAEAKTVFGNATASVIDLFCMDLVTLGQEGIGGLYGDGNLTFVDGYRELNITNYGTDYYGLTERILYADYIKLNDRERAYFQLEYQCATAIPGKYDKGAIITSEEYDDLTPEEQACFVVTGVCSIYAGRMMNTVQRADYLGVFGSRMVMKGARDRVPAEVDYTNYTINRVGEVALHQKTVSSTKHGNYFGIYNIVNYLGALTSDVKFSDTMEGQSTTYYNWKVDRKGKQNRNKGNSHNEVALASGVYLELLQEPSRNYVGDDKNYGPITGIVQLNLIAAATGEGGGYVYAKNVHGTQSTNDNQHLILAESNRGAITYRAFDYAESLSTDPTEHNWMQSSGNFVSSTQTIIDECFPTANSYFEDKTSEYSPAHYWFIKGDFYVYNQEISAYTGSAQAYIENVSIPLTILAQGNAKLYIEDIKTNLYADSLTFAGADSVICNGITYYGNDPISYWDYYNLSAHDKQYFVEKSYTCVADVYMKETDAENGIDPVHRKGEVFQPAGYDTLRASYYDNKGNAIAKDRAFRLTNALSRDNGYLLAVSLDQPELWDEYYTLGTNANTKITKKAYDALNTNDQANYKLGPTYHLNGDNNTYHIFGQSEYKVADLIEKGLYDKYMGLDQTARENLPNQAVFEPAYMALTTCDINVGNKVYHVVERSAIPKSRYDSISDNTQKSYFAEAYIGLETIKLTDKLLLSSDQLYSYAELAAYANQYDQITTTGTAPNLVFNGYPRAYFCKKAGNYGGTAFTSGQNYQAAMYTNLNKTERQNFSFNYDGLDIMYDPTYAGNIKLYDRDPVNAPLYSGNQQIDYKVIYTGTSGMLYGFGNTFTLNAVNGTTYTRQQYESLANEKTKYVQIAANAQTVENNQTAITLYVVATPFGKQSRVYNYGEVISSADYEKLTETEQGYIDILTLTPDQQNGGYNYQYNNETVKHISGIDDQGKIECYLSTDQYTKPNGNTVVPAHILITKSEYNALSNYQKDFEVVAAIPREKSALYVSRDCDIYDFTEDRIFTIIYRYNYAEPNDDGVYNNVSERHILNIRVHFESGEPIIGELLAPSKLIPGSVIGLTKPSVQKGAFEVLGGGWELYENENNALTHKNGIPYENYVTPMYWYQNQWYVAYYAETYLGRTFSNAVPFTIVNYHDLDNVMADSVNHLHIDHPSININSRIYVDNRTTTSDNTKSELDLLYDLFDLSLQSHGQTELRDEQGNIVTDDQGHALMVDDYDIKYNRNGELKNKHYALNSHVKGLENLEIILNSDVQPLKYTGNIDWKQIGTDSQCFEGTMHGNGYTVSGINKSLFYKLCGDVYNLGVRGSIEGSGIADNGDGYARNCWLINESDASLGSYKAILNSGTIINSYYNDDASYGNGDAISKPMSSFMNGEVAYNLNGFYLNKRHEDHDANGSGERYWYYTVDSETDQLTAPTEGYSNDSLYVEKYYMDGQYVYANGTIPSGLNERFSDKEGKHYPIYPDDYIYFGQKLTYGIESASSDAHDVQPKHIIRNSQRIDETLTGNRVYRAPAYFGSSQKDEAYFNPNAAFAATYQGTDAYAGMTAIDFSGYNDNTWTDGASQNTFFKPTLDCGDILRFNVQGLTQNLLVYVTGQNTVLTDALTDNEPSLAYTDNNYKNVSTVSDNNTQKVKGHLVTRIDGNYVADGSHFLVDKQDFNAPISYSYTGANKMWYQRVPEQYVTSMSGGWEAISLPFTAEVVTTQNKGEITHFYTGSKIGHEYWLREFSTVNSTDEKVEFCSLAAGNTNKEVTNTYLWDYYYSKNRSKDKNQDDYQTYYNTSRGYSDYPLYQAAKPYLIGFPGSRYYEFDLSGNFVAQNTAQTVPAQIGKQTITFVSKSGQTIAVTDGEYNVTPDADGYAYHPIYQTKTVENAYVVTDGGTKFTKTASATTVPFRAYLTKTTSQGAQGRTATRAAADIEILYISNPSDNDQMEQIVVDRSLNAYAQGMAICIESTLETPATITITSASGKLLKQFTIQPGTKATVPVNSRGIYIVNRQKIAITR